MKKVLSIPFRYVLSLLLFALFVCGYTVLSFSAQYPGLNGNENRLLYIFIVGLKTSLFVGGIMSVLILLSSIVRMQSKRLPALFLLFLIATPSFLFGYYALGQLELRQVEQGQSLSNRTIISSMDANSILRFDGGGIFFSRVEENSLTSAVLYHHGNLIPKPYTETDNDNDPDYELLALDPGAQNLSYIANVPYRVDTEELFIPSRSGFTPDGEGLLIPAANIKNAQGRLFSQSIVLESIDPLFWGLSTTMDAYSDSISIRYVALVSALFFFIFSTLLFFRLTRWPLINFYLALLINIGGLLLTRIQELPAIQNALSSFLPEQALAYFVPAVLVFLALIFIIINALLPSINDWAREMNK